MNNNTSEKNILQGSEFTSRIFFILMFRVYFEKLFKTTLEDARGGIENNEKPSNNMWQAGDTVTDSSAIYSVVS